MRMNRMHNVKNPYQGPRPRVLCVCSAGLLRSPTIAHVIGNAPYNCNPRAVGVSEEYALIPVDEALLSWADMVVCAEDWHAEEIKTRYEEAGVKEKPIYTLNVPDEYPCMHPTLITEVEECLKQVNFPHYTPPVPGSEPKSE